MKEETFNTLAGRAYLKGLGTLSSHVWEACCARFGVGGMPEAQGAYEQIMKRVLEELK